MSKQTKDILGLLAIALPACLLIFVVWLHSPMYEEVKREQRLGAQLFLMGTYSYDDPRIDEQALIDHYGFKDEDINPRKIMDNFILTQYTANKTEVFKPSPTIDGYIRGLIREVWGADKN